MGAGNRPASGDAVSYPADISAYIKLNANSSIPPARLNGTIHPTLVGNIPASHLLVQHTVSPPHILP